MLHFLQIRRQKLLKASFLVALLILYGRNAAVLIQRSCRRLGRNQGWWSSVWETYSDARFKKTFRVSRKTFSFILQRIRPALEIKTVVEDPVEPAFRLAIYLYRLGHGTYYHTLSEMCGLGLSTVATITKEVSEAIVEELWDDCISTYMPSSKWLFATRSWIWKKCGSFLVAGLRLMAVISLSNVPGVDWELLKNITTLKTSTLSFLWL